MTNCQGAYAAIDVPGALVSKHMPASYTPRYLNGQLAVVLLELQACEKVSVDGLDHGPASFGLVKIAITNPPGPPEVPNVFSFYLYELRTDNPILACWFGAAGAPTLAGSTIHSNTPLPPPDGLSHVASSLQADNETVYAFEGLPYQQLFHNQYHERYFFGSDPSRDFVEELYANQQSAGDGPAALRVAAGSPLSDLTEGAPTWPSTASIYNGISRVFVPAGGNLTRWS